VVPGSAAQIFDATGEKRGGALLMASNYWIKLYHEILDDPKMGMMEDHTYRRTIELMLIAGEMDAEGILPPINDIAWRMRTSQDDVLDVLERLQDLRIAHQEGDMWVLTNFAERQSPMSASERGRRFREAQRKREYYNGKTAAEQTVTNEETNDERKPNDTFADIDKIRLDKIRLDKIGGDGIFSTSQIAALNIQYEQTSGTLITPFIGEDLHDLATGAELHRLELPPGASGADIAGTEWVIEAIKEAGRAKNDHYRNLSVNFVRSIIERWMQEGYKAAFKTAKQKVSERETQIPERTFR